MLLLELRKCFENSGGDPKGFYTTGFCLDLGVFRVRIVAFSSVKPVGSEFQNTHLTKL
jgi:hypothetical protein